MKTNSNLSLDEIREFEIPWPLELTKRGELRMRLALLIGRKCCVPARENPHYERLVILTDNLKDTEVRCLLADEGAMQALAMALVLQL